MGLQPDTFKEALERKLARPSKPRKPLQRSQMVRKPNSLPQAPKTSHRAISRKRKGRKRSVTSLKKAAWTQFSIWIRTRGADDHGYQHCFTCNVRKPWKNLEAGHLVPGRTNAVLFDERAVRPQCRKCNGHLRGNIIVYYPKLVGMLGQIVVDEIVARKDITHKWLPGELEEIAAHYKVLNDANEITR